jgi:hypothetical protein
MPISSTKPIRIPAPFKYATWLWRPHRIWPIHECRSVAASYRAPAEFGGWLNLS